MLLRHIFETPISNWEVSSQFDDREKAMQASYSKEFPNRTGKFQHYTKADKSAIRSSATISKIRLAFSKMPVKINLFFYHHDKPDYDPFLQKGQVDIAWVTRKMGSATAAEIQKWMEPDAINVIMTNNLSDNHPVSLKSPWMVAHRIVHAVAQGENPSLSKGGAKLNSIVEKFIHDLLATAYGYKFDFSYFGRDAMLIYKDQIDILGTELGKVLGTFRSAREGSLVQVTDWTAEMFTQWMLTGKVVFNKLPEIFDERRLTEDPEKLRQATKLLNTAPTRFSRIFSSIAENAKGHIWVM